MTVAEQRAKQGLPALGKKPTTPTRTSRGGGGGSSVSIEERRGKTVITETKDGVTRKTYVPRTWRGREITDVSKSGGHTPSQFQQRVAAEQLGPRREPQSLGTPVLYGEGYDPLGVSFVRTATSKTPDGSVSKFKSTTLYPLNKNVRTIKQGVVEQTVIQPKAPAPPTRYPDTSRGRFYAKVVDFEEKERQVGLASDRLVEPFRKKEYDFYFGKWGGEVAANVLATPAKLTAGFGGELYLAGQKLGLMYQAQRMKKNDLMAEDVTVYHDDGSSTWFAGQDMGMETRKSERAALTKIPRELGSSYNILKPEGFTNLATAGMFVGLIGKGRGASRATTPQGEVTMHSRIKSYKKGDIQYGVQKGEFVSQSGKPVSFEYRTGLAKSGKGTGVLRMKTKKTGEILVEREMPISTRTEISPKLGKYNLPIEGTFKYKQKTSTGRTKTTEVGELRITDINKKAFEEFKEYSRYAKRQDMGGIEASRVRQEGGVVVRDVLRRSEGELARPSRGGMGKRGETRGSFMGELELPSVHRAELDVGGLSRVPDIGVRPTFDVIGGRVGARSLPKSMVSSQGLMGVDSQSISNVMGKSLTKTSMMSEIRGVSLPKGMVDVTGKAGADSISITGIDTVGGDFSRTISARDFGGGDISIPRPPPPPPPPGMFVGLPNIPNVLGHAGKKKRRAKGKKKGAYTPSFAVLAGTKGFGIPKIKVPKTKLKKMFTGFELRGVTNA